MRCLTTPAGEYSDRAVNCVHHNENGQNGCPHVGGYERGPRSKFGTPAVNRFKPQSVRKCARSCPLGSRDRAVRRNMFPLQSPSRTGPARVGVAKRHGQRARLPPCSAKAVIHPACHARTSGAPIPRCTMRRILSRRISARRCRTGHPAADRGWSRRVRGCRPRP